ncbi:MAG: hypothetical protein GY708_11940 [Actinomycetia bacterium]|nr:hypothetical protein [Actinomycetes bacterium]MCP4958975.1 hypothetical protein [Actinomycetes bacterium]
MAGEIDARGDVVAVWPFVFQGLELSRVIFLNTESVIRLVGALLGEVDDEMISSDRRYIAATTTRRDAIPQYASQGTDGTGYA